MRVVELLKGGRISHSRVIRTSTMATPPIELGDLSRALDSLSQEKVRYMCVYIAPSTWTSIRCLFVMGKDSRCFRFK